jgi:glucosyl-dolichyl phosphate glucuronosyltransferase
MTSPVGATVIIPTYRRPEGLARALTALAGQEDPGTSWDVVVIDNDADPGSERAFAAAAGGLPIQARYVRESQRGSAYARNRGIAEADGEIVAMLDDDVTPAQNWLAELLAPILAGRCDGTGGRVVLDPSVERPVWFDEPPLGSYLGSWDLGDAEREIDPSVIGQFLITSNCAMRTEVLRASGGFDPSLGPRGRTPLVNDDVLLTRRVAAAGGRLRWVPAALVVHDLPPDRLRPRYLFKRAWAQGRSDWRLDADFLATRRFGGARVAMSWLGNELKRRSKEGIRHRKVAFHLALDVARTAGSLREATTLRRRASTSR